MQVTPGKPVDEKRGNNRSDPPRPCAAALPVRRRFSGPIRRSHDPRNDHNTPAPPGRALCHIPHLGDAAGGSAALTSPAVRPGALPRKQPGERRRRCRPGRQPRPMFRVRLGPFARCHEHNEIARKQAHRAIPIARSRGQVWPAFPAPPPPPPLLHPLAGRSRRVKEEGPARTGAGSVSATTEPRHICPRQKSNLRTRFRKLLLASAPS
jgi:hypothetical protein